MKIPFPIVALVSLAVFGCTGDAGSATQGQTPATPPATAGAPVADATTGSGTTGSSQATQHKYPEHFERTYQLDQLQQVTIKANGHALKVWIMDNDTKRAEGMMYLKKGDFKPNEGMIFVFPEARMQSFWMHDCFIPLDIIYVSEGKKVVNIVHGKVQDDTSLPSTGKAMYVIELIDGQAAKLGIKSGTKIEIPSSVKAIE